MRVRAAFYLSVLFVVMGLVSGCGEKEGGITEITFVHGWGSTEADHVAMREIYGDFEKENPDIRLNMLNMPTNTEMIRMVEDMITVGNTPDIIFTAGEGEYSIYRFMRDNDLLVDLSPYMEADEDFDRSVSPLIKNSWTEEDGSLYTVSDVLLMSGGYWYDRDLFDSVGITDIPDDWEGFYEMLDLIGDHYEDKGIRAWTLRPSADGYRYMADNILAGIYGTESIPQEISRRDFQMICRVWKEVYRRSDRRYHGFSYRDEAAMFNSGELGLFINGIWGASMIDPDMNAGYGLLPSDNDGKVSSQSGVLGYLLGNTGDAKRVEASVRFIQYMLREDVQRRILLETQQMPSNPEIDISEFAGELERFSGAVQVIQDAEYTIDNRAKSWSQSKRELLEENLPLMLRDVMTEDELWEILQNQDHI